MPETVQKRSKTVDNSPVNNLIGVMPKKTRLKKLVIICKVCSHRDRTIIDKALMRGQSASSLGRIYGFSHMAFSRHRRYHIPAALLASRQAYDIDTADDLLSEMRMLRTKQYALMDKAEAKGDEKTAIMAANSVSHTLKMNLDTMQLAGIEKERANAALKALVDVFADLIDRNVEDAAVRNALYDGLRPKVVQLLGESVPSVGNVQLREAGK